MSYLVPPDISSVPSEKEKERREALEAVIASEGRMVHHIFKEGVISDVFVDLTDPREESYNSDVPPDFSVVISEGDDRPTHQQVISEARPAIKREMQIARIKWATANKKDDFYIPLYW